MKRLLNLVTLVGTLAISPMQGCGLEYGEFVGGLYDCEYRLLDDPDKMVSFENRQGRLEAHAVPTGPKSDSVHVDMTNWTNQEPMFDHYVFERKDNGYFIDSWAMMINEGISVFYVEGAVTNTRLFMEAQAHRESRDDYHFLFWEFDCKNKEE